MAAEIHIEDIGTQFIITINDGSVAVDLSTASTKQIIFRKPSGSKITKNASFVNTGSDGKIKYTTLSGDLDEAGYWKIQVYLVIGSNSWKTDMMIFRVYPNL